MLLIALACSGDPPPDRGPTVVVVIACTLRADRMHLYGHDVDNTPYLDKLGTEGVVFERMLANAPWTKPAVASLISGRYPVELGIDDPGPNTNTDRGLHPSVETLAERFGSAGWATVGATANPNANEVFGFAQGFDSYHEASGLWRDGFKKVTGDEVVEAFLADADAHEGPLYGQLLLIDTHEPRSGRGSATEKYDRSIEGLDEAIEALDAGLAKQGRSDRILVLVGDHGEGLEEPVWAGPAHGTWLYEPTLHVPWLVHGPSVSKGRRVTGLAEGVDLAPTVLDLAGLDTSGTSGNSRAANISGAATETGEALTLHETRFAKEKRQRITTADWVYIRSQAKGKFGNPRGTDELYTTSDTMQTTDLSDANPEIVAQLQAQLEAKRRPLTIDALVWKMGEPLQADMLEQLEALGYVDGAPE